MAKDVVRLSDEERQRLSTLISPGRTAATTLVHARILLKADAGEGGPSWDDARIVDAVDPSLVTIHRVRQAWVAQGLEVALARKPPRGRQYRTRDGAQEAHLIALACSAPPEGRSRWTLQ
jgi:hypothetical protein